LINYTKDLGHLQVKWYLLDAPAGALDDDIDTLAGRHPANALGEAFCG
jgi:hypothetical protein